MHMFKVSESVLSHKMIAYFSVLDKWIFLCKHVMCQLKQILYTTAILVEYLLKICYSTLAHFKQSY